MAPARRFLAPDAAANSEILLSDAESHHARRVLRLGPGAEVEVFDGDGRAFAALLWKLDAAGRCLLRRLDPLPARESLIRLTVAVAIPKGDGLTVIVRQLAELGASSVVPLTTERSEGTTAPSRVRRWRAAALAGARQCGRAAVPTIHAPEDWGSFLRGALAGERWIAVPGSPGADGPAVAPLAAPAEQVVAIGPEGGFSDRELGDAERRDFRRLCLGSRVLRTGTAAVVATTVLLGEPSAPLIPVRDGAGQPRLPDPRA